MLRVLHPIMYDINIGAPGQPKCVDIIVPLNDISDKKFYLDLQASIKHYGKPYRLWHWDGEKGELKLIEDPSDITAQIDKNKDPLCIVCVAKAAKSSLRFGLDGRFAGALFGKNKSSWKRLVGEHEVSYDAKEKNIFISNCYSFFIFYDKSIKTNTKSRGYSEYKSLKEAQQAFAIHCISPDMVQTYLKQPMPSPLESEAELRKHLKEGFQSYIKLIKEEYNEKFDHGFKLFKKSRATNRKINYLLAQDLLKQLDEDVSLDDLFKASSITELRKQIIQDESTLSASEKKKFKKDTIHSQKLNGVINLYKKYTKQKAMLEKNLKKKLKS